jgi:hypothetical protein
MTTKAISVMSYPIGRAAEQYRDVVKPVLVTVAKRLGYAVGKYSGNGSPCTTLRCNDADSPVDCLVVYWNGTTIEVGVRSRAWRREMRTGIGQLAHAMSFGVHEAYGRSSEPELEDRIERAIADALREFAKKEK